MQDVRRTVTRTIKNNFLDAAVQEAIDALLGANVDRDAREDLFLPDPTLRKLFEDVCAALLTSSRVT